MIHFRPIKEHKRCDVRVKKRTSDELHAQLRREVYGDEEWPDTSPEPYWTGNREHGE